MTATVYETFKKKGRRRRRRINIARETLVGARSPVCRLDAVTRWLGRWRWRAPSTVHTKSRRTGRERRSVWFEFRQQLLLLLRRWKYAYATADDGGTGHELCTNATVTRAYDNCVATWSYYTMVTVIVITSVMKSSDVFLDGRAETERCGGRAVWKR